MALHVGGLLCLRKSARLERNELKAWIIRIGRWYRVVRRSCFRRVRAPFSPDMADVPLTRMLRWQ